MPSANNFVLIASSPFYSIKQTATVYSSGQEFHPTWLWQGFEENVAEARRETCYGSVGMLFFFIRLLNYKHFKKY